MISKMKEALDTMALNNFNSLGHMTEEFNGLRRSLDQVKHTTPHKDCSNHCSASWPKPPSPILEDKGTQMDCIYGDFQLTLTCDPDDNNKTCLRPIRPLIAEGSTINHKEDGTQNRLDQELINYLCY